MPALAKLDPVPEEVPAEKRMTINTNMNMKSMTPIIQDIQNSRRNSC